MMGIVMLETCWAYKKYNKIISGIYLIFILQLVVDVSKGRNTGTEQARGQVGAIGGNAPNRNSEKKEKVYLYMYVQNMLISPLNKVRRPTACFTSPLLNRCG